VPAVVWDVGAVSLTGLDVSPGCSVRQARGTSNLPFAHAGAFQLKAVGAVDDAVDDRVPDRQITKGVIMPPCLLGCYVALVPSMPRSVRR
jgi:hypothetical protein